jgi:TolC family type I secretion outer membrane protein
MPYRKFLWCAPLLLLGLQAARAQSLQEALTSAYLNNPQLKADYARQRGLDEDMARAASGWKPVVTLNGQAGGGNTSLYYGYLPAPYTQKEHITPESLGLSISEPLYDGGRTQADIDRAKSAIIGGRAHSEAVETAVLSDALQGYYDLYRDRALLELSKRNVTWLEDEMKATRSRFKVKDVTITDVAQADARLAQGLAQQAAATGAVAASESGFIRTTGLNPAVLPPPPLPPDAFLPASLPETLVLVEQSPTVREAREAIHAAEADVDFAASYLRPNLSLQLSSQYSSETSQGKFKQRINEVTGNLAIPLYEGGQYYARVRQAKQMLAQREQEFDAADQQARDRAGKAWAQLTTARMRIDLLKRQVASAEAAEKNVRAEVRVGSRTVLDLLNAEQELLNSQTALLQAEHDAALGVYVVLGSVGRLNAEILGLPVHYYNPDDNYRAEASRWAGTNIPIRDKSSLDR